MRAGGVHGLGELPAEEVGEAVVGDLAATDGVVQEPQRLLQRGRGVLGVRLVWVDLVRAEPAKRFVERAVQVTAGGADVVGA